MRNDLTTLEMLKEVRLSLRWTLVERVTHLLLAVVVGYWIRGYEKSDIEKSYEKVQTRAAELLQARREAQDNDERRNGRSGH